MRKIIVLGLAGLALVYAVACLGIYAAMRQPPERFGAIMTRVPDAAFLILPFRPLWLSARAGTLQVGDAAPEIDLPTLDRSHNIRLSSEYRTKPVVLIFGSYT